MERLTHERMNGIKKGYWSPNKKDELVGRLAAYENTGLTPEEIIDLNEFENSNGQKLLLEIEKHKWNPVEERLPVNSRYILLSFTNFSLPLIGRYEDGAFYIGDCDEHDTCVSQDLFVNAWMELQEAYRPERNDNPERAAGWKEAVMRTFLGGRV